MHTQHYRVSKIMHIEGQLFKQIKESDYGGQRIGMGIGIKGE